MWRTASLAVAIAAVVSSAAYIIWKVGGIGNGPCGQAIGAAQQWGIVAACVVAFGAGHTLARHRHEERDPQMGDVVREDRVEPGAFRSLRRAATYVRTGRATRPDAWRSGALITHGALILFYVASLIAIAYETVAVWNGSNIPPITDFVRCARNADVGWTIVVAGTVSFLAGHWLWPVSGGSRSMES